MGDKNLQAFLKAVYDHAVAKCGDTFADHLRSLRQERERLLKNSWKKTPPEDVDSESRIFREIDFDTIQLHASKFLSESDYWELLYEIARLAVPYGQFHRAQQLLLVLKDNPGVEDNHSFAVRVHQRLGDISFYLSDFDTALEEYELCADLYSKLADTRRLIGVMNSMSVVLVEKGEVERAEKLMLEARDRAEVEQFDKLLIKISMNLGNIYHLKGDYDASLANLQTTLDLLGSNNDRPLKAQIYHNMGIAHKAKYEDEQALDCFNRSIELSVTNENFYMKSLSYLEKSEILYRQNELSAGTALATSAFQAFSQFGDRLSMGETYKILGMISGKREDYRTALAFLENSLRISRDHNKPLNIGQTQVEMARVYQQQGDNEQAREFYNDARVSFTGLHAVARANEVEQALAGLTA